MRIALVAVAGLVVGLGAGTGVSAVKVKGRILEARALAKADSLAASGGHASADAADADSQDAAHADDGAFTVILPPEDTAQGVEADTAAAHLPAMDLPAEAVAQAGGSGPAAVPADTVSPGGTDSVAVADAGTGAAGATSGGASRAAPIERPSEMNPDGAKKLAKIFAAMKAADAAAVLTQMTDEEVTVILLQMQDRQAGPIVSAFPAERAAVLGSSLLRARGGGA